ncbi:MAG: hypothetical protein DYG89_41655 [Caldilinea sp. CFX5]|nr:hypothetical protein [Caldilinea sp. CFX5]
MKTRTAISPIPRLPLLFSGLFLLFLLLCFPYATAALITPVAQSSCDFAATDEASLRSAIDGVNQAAGGVCTIQIAGYTIELTQPLPPITNANLNELMIDGQAHTIWARRTGRVLNIQSVKQLTIHDLTLSGGLVTDTGSGIDDWGGGLRLYCGEDRECAATLTKVSFFGNQAVEGGGLSLYCAAGSRCATRLVDSSLLANEATAGGAITTGFDEANLAFSLELLRTTVWSNRAEEGGGIRLRGADFTAVDSTIRENRATTGGGIAMIAGSYILRANVTGSAIFDNVATQRGGGLYIRSADPGDVQLTLANSTVSGNRVTDTVGIGGGIAMSATYGLQADLINSTVANNSAANGAGIYFALEDDSFAPATLLTLANSLIADNQGGSACTLFLQQPPVKGVPLLTSRGHNLDSDGTCLPPAVRQPGDLPNGNANLAPLTDNRGHTWTQALQLGSDAIDAGDDAICAAAPINAVDQRGDPRPQGPHCDIGAYERPNPPGCTYPHLIAGDEAAFRQAITCVNLAGPGAYTITVAADITYTQPLFPLSNPALTSVVLAGNGHTLNAQGQGRVLTLEDVPALTLRDLTLTGGKANVQEPTGTGGGVAFDCTRDLACTWTLINTVVRNNQAEAGGGIDYFCSAGGGGSLVLQDSVIRDNRAASAGGGLLYSTDEDSQACSVTLRNTVVEGNQALDGGGLRIARPRVTISDSTIRNNHATQTGGGLMARISDGFIDMTVLRSTISGNRAGVSGGGVYIASPDQRFDIQFINSTISGNRVDNGNGGGFYLQENEGSLLIGLINSTVTENAAVQGAGVHIFDRAAAPSYYTSTLRLTNSLIADNQGSDCTGEAEAGVVFTGQRVLSFGHNLDSDGSCLTPEVRQAGDIPNGNANLGPLANNGGPTLTHQPLTGSQAIDAGDDAVCAAAPVNGIDQRSATRPQGAGCDIGAVEATAQAVSDFLFVSSRSSGRAGNITFRDEDIVAYDFTNNTWQMIFDGSDLGVTKDVDAFAFRADGSLLLSFNGPMVIPGQGPVDDSDLVAFTPTRLGSDTAGSFALYLRGADVGLTTDGEDIDAIGFTADGKLVVSTIGDFDAPNAQGHDEDLFLWDNGVWQHFFEGAKAGLGNEDVNSLWIDPATGGLYLTVKDDFAFADVSVDANDIFVCTPVASGGCTFRRFWDSDVRDYGSENLDHIGLGPLPATLVVDGQPRNAELLTAEEIAADKESDDHDVVEGSNRLYLPWVVGK